MVNSCTEFIFPFFVRDSHSVSRRHRAANFFTKALLDVVSRPTTSLPSPVSSTASRSL